ncbi:MAG TPA: ABC-2 family transporter protein [Anaerolineaceae bacterium]|nr:ABC-2 family transporter protein [Anaerolineaceae bacterium]
MLNIYRHFWQVTWAEQWQYRANLLMYLLYWLVSPIVYLSIWVTIANAQGSVNGLTANDFITYYLTLLIVDQFTSEITIHTLAYKIQDGTFSGDLLRPVHPILTGSLVYNLAFKVLNLIGFVPIWILLFVLFHPNYSSVTLNSVLLCLPAVALGFALDFLFGAIITCMAFWTTRVYSISQFFNLLVMMLAGQLVPLQLMPTAVQQIANLLPFQMFTFVPVEIGLNRLPLADMLRDYTAGLVWLLILYVLFQWVWREGIKRFSSVGA